MFNSNEKYIIINYHYVQDPRPDAPGIFPCSVFDFEKQIKFLSGNYKIVSIPEVFDAAQASREVKYCAITFDDGLKGQYANALPILNKYNASATFFPITSTLKGRLPIAHKTHAILSRLSPSDAIDFFNKFISDFYPDLKTQHFVSKNQRLTNKRLHEDVPSANFKEVLILLPEDIKGRFLRHFFKTLKLNEKEICKNTFMNIEEIQTLAKFGMTIGNHSHSHYTFDIINEETMKNDLSLAGENLADILGNRPYLFSYPHGRFSDTAVKILGSAGFGYAVTIERRGIRRGDQQLLIPRYDTMDLKNHLTN